jgi:hypothetical protein
MKEKILKEDIISKLVSGKEPENKFDWAKL